ncbi:ABC transporter substrate-binding protein [Paenibacillus rigui]|uniref:Myristoyl transferase n=1 Tax=Paenibacillus rigui TaxID=554312 RepID=A0A229UWH7_9BACL|nr:ABC transporter substrate-binding protein [Paenibacillus rigui]OXM87768.1 myristoyl transferase [Paenibacillus rigui]
MKKKSTVALKTALWSRSFVLSLCAAALASGLVACGAKEPVKDASASPSAPAAAAPAANAEKSKVPEEKKTVAVTQVTNWFAEPEHGGQYAALMKGYYKDAGFDMTIMPGGPQVSAAQIVASGKAQFGMIQGDDLIIARQQGIPLVAVAAAFQKNPQGLIFHKGQQIKDFADLNGRKVYVASAAGYWEFIKKKYNLDKVQDMKYTGQLVNFINDPTAVTQGYITAEPYSLKQQGYDTEMLLNADSGYNPYANVLFTTEKMIKEHPDQVKAFVEASIKGWEYYKDHADEVNPKIKESNPDMTLDAMKFGAEKQAELVYGGDAVKSGVGTMTKERWSTLMKQLSEIGVLKTEEDVSKVFTTEFLPKK